MAVQHCPCFNLGLAHRKLSRVFEEALAPLGLTMAQAHFLSCLFEEDGRLSKDLARELGVDAGTLTPMIDRLERQGLVSRCPAPEDRRAARICLQPKGRELQSAIAARTNEVMCAITSQFSDEDYERFIDLVRKMSAAADHVARADRETESDAVAR